ncbi:LPXTG cell wall anchor domain-containing protein [Glycomyces tarimensis]
MNRTLKRVLGLTGSVALGLAGAVTFASAAQAHHVEIEGSSDCADDGWVANWEVQDWFEQSHMGPGVIFDIISTPDAEIVGDIAEGTPLPPLNSGTLLTGTQTFGADVTQVTLEIWAEWPNGKKDKGTATVSAPTDCAPGQTPTPEAGATAWSDCFGLNVVVANHNPDALAEFTLEPSTGEPVTVAPEAGEDNAYTEYFAVEDAEAGLSVTVYVDGEEFETYTWDGGGNCEWGVIYDTCEGLEFELSIPEDGVETTYTLTPSEGDEVVVTLAPGETETVTFVATGDELTVAYLIEDDKNFYEGEVPWTKPEGCEEAPVESETPSAAPQLPTTGSSMTIMIGAASALVLAAAVLFFIARRRRAAADW